MSIRDDLIRRLADGRLHSGEDLAEQAGCTRAAIWKQLHALRDIGLEPTALRGQGYRLPRPIELFDEQRLRECLSEDNARRLRTLTIEMVTDSTSQRLRAMPPPPAGSFDFAVAEFQTAGRGRRGRQWLSPLGSGICLSVSWQFAAPPDGLAALGLAAGVAVHSALSSAGGEGLQLKWPNDVVCPGGKVAGLLIDSEGEAAGPLRVVIGVGVNLEIDPEFSVDGGLQPIGLNSLCAQAPSRNAVAGGMIEALVNMLLEFADRGFARFADQWRGLDQLCGRPVEIRSGDRRIAGTARGISPDGGLLVETAGELRTVVSGDVSVRAA